MSEREKVATPHMGDGAGRPDAIPVADMSEVDLVLALAETGDHVDDLVTRLENGDNVGDLLARACSGLTDIEDELLRRGFSHQILST